MLDPVCSARPPCSRPVPIPMSIVRCYCNSDIPQPNRLATALPPAAVWLPFSSWDPQPPGRPSIRSCRGESCVALLYYFAARTEPTSLTASMWSGAGGWRSLNACHSQKGLSTMQVQQAGTGLPIATVLRPAKTPGGLGMSRPLAVRQLKRHDELPSAQAAAVRFIAEVFCH